MIPTAGDPRATVYGPAVLRTARVDDPQAIAALHAARAPAIPAAPPCPFPPMPVPPPLAPPFATPRPGTPPLVLVGAALAIALPPVGCVVSAYALGRILEATPRPRGELLAVMAVALSMIAMAAMLVAFS